MLQDINQKTDYQEFKRKWGADPRFEALDRKEREVLFNEKYGQPLSWTNDFEFLLWNQIDEPCVNIMHCQLLSRVKAVQEKVQSMRKAVIADFKSMLRESKDITSTCRWAKVSILSHFTEHSYCNNKAFSTKEVGVG